VEPPVNGPIVDSDIAHQLSLFSICFIRNGDREEKNITSSGSSLVKIFQPIVLRHDPRVYFILLSRSPDHCCSKVLHRQPCNICGVPALHKPYFKLLTCCAAKAYYYPYLPVRAGQIIEWVGRWSSCRCQSLDSKMFC
jgi:hypothetical protein